MTNAPLGGGFDFMYQTGAGTSESDVIDQLQQIQQFMAQQSGLQENENGVNGKNPEVNQTS